MYTKNLESLLSRFLISVDIRIYGVEIIMNDEARLG